MLTPWAELLRRFDELTAMPMLLNTFFNENEPIVSTPAQAMECFLRTNIDAMAIGSLLLLKSAQTNRIRVSRVLLEAIAG